jgi:hypothetical protein
MSGEYMRQIMEAIDRANVVNEGYSDRVQAVADRIMKNNTDGITRKMFQSEFKRAAEIEKAVEMRGSEQARRDFEKDVMSKIDFKRDGGAQSDKKARVEKALEQLSRYIEEAVGNSFPDGDPFDEIAPKARRLGIPMDSLIDWLNRATKKHLGFKDYYTYLSTVWDDYSDMTAGGEEEPRRNPWR